MDKPTFSFGFTKKSEVKKLQSSAIKDGDQDKKEETDYLVSLEDNQIKRFVVFVLCIRRLLNVHSERHSIVLCGIRLLSIHSELVNNKQW